MKIKWLGHSSFLIQGEKATVITDPYDEIGLEFPSVTADIVTVSHDHFDHCATSKVGGSPRIVNKTGAAEVSGVQITGFPTYHDTVKGSQRGQNTVFRIRLDGITLCHLGDLGHALSETQVSQIGSVDILFVPVGGVYTIDAKGAKGVVEALKPRIVIPMHYRVSGLSLGIAPVTDFTKIMGKFREESVLEVAAGTLPKETTVVVLKLAL
jgi:L-ascorbate metabolism protein UlaG (beta-lactamase superfamily)